MPSRRRCWRRGGRVARRDGGWAPRPRRSCFGRGDFLPRREGPRPHALATSPHPPRRAFGSPALLNHVRWRATHAPDPDQPRYALSLTTWLAPCAALRVFFSTTFDSLASAPNDGLLLAEAAYLQVLLAHVDAAPDAQKKGSVLSASTRVRCDSVHACAM